MMREIRKLNGGHYDVLVIGGGINGAAVAHLASLNGLRVALLEKDDFASGTSSKSTKLVHGGLRYLENMEFSLVREALKERTIQLRSAPHLVKPLGFIIPVYREDKRPFWMMKLGVALYDFLSGKYLIHKHSQLTKEEVKYFIPDIKPEGLIGGILYYDAQMDDSRLVLENILMADHYGAHIANYVEARELIKENGKTVGVVGFDFIHQTRLEVHAEHIVCTVGPWANQFMAKDQAQSLEKLRLTKGVHIVYKDKLSDHAVLITTQKDGRVFFIIPFRNHSLIGTTDTDYQGDLNQVEVDEADTEYLLTEAKRVFPSYEFKRENIITQFAGLRPLVHSPGNPSQVSRQHVIEESYSHIFFVMGGKYTTYRKIAEDTLKKILPSKPKDTQKTFTVYGGGMLPEDPALAAAEFGIEEGIVRHLIGIYGSRYKDVLQLTRASHRLKQKICDCTPTIRAQIHYSINIEMARTPEDIIVRRLGLAYHGCDKRNCFKEIRNILAEYRF